ncbi:peptidase inhibitor family I36 protein [Streptomyces enissocaesilis]|uniref:Peptidase inhibitor family I36 n=1 Tax=Streptomyces enissocaesilis TaxID=332589 RepID=A0ABN3X2G9_9ACTN
MNKRALGALATAAAIACVLTAAPTASAAEVPPGCDKGYFCIYSGDSGTGRLVLKSDGNWSGRVTGQSIFNNGAPLPGLDHIQVEWKGIGSGSECVHHYPGPGHYGLNFQHDAVINKVTWRGEC